MKEKGGGKGEREKGREGWGKGEKNGRGRRGGDLTEGEKQEKTPEFSPQIQLSDNGLGNTYLAQSMPPSTSLPTN